MKENKKRLLRVMCVALMLVGFMFNMTGCTLKEKDGFLDTSEEIKVEKKTQTEETEKTEEVIDITTEAEPDMTSEENIESGAGDSYNIGIGTMTLTLTPPVGATDVYAGDYMVSYDYDAIHVEYSDSFCALTDNALEMMMGNYEAQADGIDDLDTSASIEPVETQVGNFNAYYYKLVDTYTDGSSYVNYTFLVDIGADNYLEVVISGMADDFTDADAFEIANLKLK